jgi:hypothetical protein
MASRIPINLLSNLQLTTSLTDASYTVPANSVATISACTLNNTTATARTVTVNVIPTGSAAATNQIITTITIPAAGAAPTIVSSLVGQHLLAGWKVQMLADSATAVTPLVSGYLTTI